MGVSESGVPYEMVSMPRYRLGLLRTVKAPDIMA